MMKKVFHGFNRDILYRRCLLGSIAHAIMVGEYNLLSAAQSWDGQNYNFMDFEGVRGVISFAKNQYICVIQNTEKWITGKNEILSKLLSGAEQGICDLAVNEALLYLLVEGEGCDIPAATAAFWGDAQNTYSNMEEEDLLEDSQQSIVPFICSEQEAKEYWIADYEMKPGQIALMEEIYDQKIHADSKLILDQSIKDKLISWFDNIDECIESFSEMGIYFE
ncbi:MAG: hypothetical protein K2O91_14760 [Lachnospiraceae bacterium]|nr:hypothetical protein [Lachnospiraceae bacterium]